MVPTEVPIAVDTKRLITNSTATEYFDGMIDSRKYATLSALFAADDADKYSGGHEYEYHGDDVLVADALAHKLKLFVKAQGAVLKTGDGGATRNATTMGIL